MSNYDPFSNICPEEYGIHTMQLLQLLPTVVRSKYKLSPVDSIFHVSERCVCNRGDGTHIDKCYEEGGILRDSEKRLIREILVSGNDCFKIHNYVIDKIQSHNRELATISDLLYRLSEEQKKLRQEINDIKGLPVISVNLADE